MLTVVGNSRFRKQSKNRNAGTYPDTARARKELGWKPLFTTEATLRELLDGLREGAGMKTPPLDPASSGPLRSREFATGVGATDKLR